MNITFTIDGLKLKDDKLSFKKENEISMLYREMTKQFNNQLISIDNIYDNTNLNIKFPDNVNIKILLVDNKEIFSYYFEDYEKTMGFFNINNAEGILGESELADEFVVLVEADPQSFNDLYNTYKDRITGTKSDFLNRYLITLTHELNHAFEFIQNAGGLTPMQVDEFYQSGKFPYSVDQCCTGYGLEMYKDVYQGLDEDQDADTIESIMEDRVENKGVEMFKNLDLSFLKLKQSTKIRNKNKP